MTLKSTGPRTAIFTRLVRDIMQQKPLTAPITMPVAELVARMSEAQASSMVIVDVDDRPAGILTEQDVTRRIAFRVDGEADTGSVMTAPVESIGNTDHLFRAIARMRRLNLRHMPVVQRNGSLVGMLNLHDAMAAASESLMEQIDNLTWDTSVDGLTQVKAYQVELADELFDENLPVSDIQAVLTDINNDIYRRVVDLNLLAMKEDGLGDPPVAFSVIVMGSGGRGENYIYPDQDNGFILDDYPDDQHTKIDGWFIELAERMTRDLDTVGLPKCKGFVMATNPLWRKTLPQWKEQVRLWCRKRSTTTLRLCDIFFDFRTVWGDPSAGDDLREHIAELAARNPILLQQLLADNQDKGVGLSLFRRFIVEKDEPDHRGKINLKQTATLPLVEGIRLLSLRERITDTSTLARMAALQEHGVLDDNEHDYLRGAFHMVCRLLLRQQIEDFKAGRRVSNYVHPRTLSQRETDILKDSMEAIDRLRKRIRSEFTADIF